MNSNGWFAGLFSGSADGSRMALGGAAGRKVLLAQRLFSPETSQVVEVIFMDFMFTDMNITII